MTLVAVIAVVIFASYIFTPSESIFNEPLREITPRQLLTVALTILMWIVAIYVCIFLGVRIFKPPKDHPNVRRPHKQAGHMTCVYQKPNPQLCSEGRLFAHFRV
jgi:hypothetical protein